MVVSSDWQSKPGDEMPHKIFQVPFKSGYLEERLIRPALEGNKHAIGRNTHLLHLEMCDYLLKSTDRLQELKDFDLIVYDTFAPCAVLVSELLNLPNVIVATAPPNYAFSIYHMVPMPLSYVPIRETGFTSNMTFVQRVMNVGLYCLSKVLLDILFVRSFDALKAKYNINPDRSFKQGYSDSELVIFLADFAIEYPQPLLPGWFFFLISSSFCFKYSRTGSHKGDILRKQKRVRNCSWPLTEMIIKFSPGQGPKV